MKIALLNVNNVLEELRFTLWPLQEVDITESHKNIGCFTILELFESLITFLFLYIN